MKRKDDPADICPKAFLELFVWELIPDHTCLKNYSWRTIYQSRSTYPLSETSDDLSIIDRKYSESIQYALEDSILDIPLR